MMWLDSVTTKSTKCSLFSTLGRGTSLKRKDLQALTLVGPSRNNPVLDPPSCTTPRQPTINVFPSQIT